ncbi:hypothetical protein ACFE04_012221 [Oxalis oulophora]
MESENPYGLIITSTESIRNFLQLASTDPKLTKDLQQTALDLSLRHNNNIPYKIIRDIWVQSNPETRPELIRLFNGSGFVFTSPKPREKSEELKARLRKLAENAERKEYKELVKDITPKIDDTEPFSSYKDQLGFGLHVVVLMFTGYLVGHASFKALFGHSPAMSAAGGILGLVGVMLVETLLFIIRTSNHDRKLSSSSSSNLKKNQ